MPSYSVVFWNLENLFDVEGSAERPPWLAKRLEKELQGWTDEVLDRKIDRLVHIIRQINHGAGPDILGVCEVENKSVLNRLAAALAPLGRTYAIAHADTEDQRGIDVAFMVDSAKFETKEIFNHVILKRNATRDLFQVNLRTRDGGRDLVVIGNHWPSRRGGEYASEPYRILAAETLAYWHERSLEYKGEGVPILAMGDFNDEPFNRSLVEYALSSHQKEKVLRAQSPRLYNLMWPLLGERRGTHFYNGFANMLDQFLASKGLIDRDAPISVVEDSVRIEMVPEMVSGGAYPDPVRFGRPSSGYNPNGFSDHYPISVVLREA